MKPRKVKPVLAWALVRSTGIDVGYIVDDRNNLMWMLHDDGLRNLLRIARVEVREAPRSRKGKRR